MHTFNISTKLKENPTRSNGEIYILGQENSEGRVREDITCCMRTLIIDCKAPIIYDLNMFLIPRKYVFFKLQLNILFFFNQVPEKKLFQCTTCHQSTSIK